MIPEPSFVMWEGSKVYACEKCGVCATNVDDCGEFGNPACPRWGAVDSLKRGDLTTRLAATVTFIVEQFGDHLPADLILQARDLVDEASRPTILRPPLGAHVSHPDHGPGVITSYHQCADTDCEVNFDDEVGVLVLSLKSLQPR